jgi:hypothetical protein
MFIKINENKPFFEGNNGNTILIFTEGTVLKHKNIFGIYNYKKYVPIKNCVEKIKNWNRQGFEIKYLTSRKNIREVISIKDLLEKYDFPGNYLYFRNKTEEYHNIAEEIMPKILIEDNCKSIGGIKQTTTYKIGKSKKMLIKSILVDEFNGIDHLLDNTRDLIIFEGEK